MLRTGLIICQGIVLLVFVFVLYAWNFFWRWGCVGLFFVTSSKLNHCRDKMIILFTSVPLIYSESNQAAYGLLIIRF